MRLVYIEDRPEHLALFKRTVERVFRELSDKKGWDFLPPFHLIALRPTERLYELGEEFPDGQGRKANGPVNRTLRVLKALQPDAILLDLAWRKEHEDPADEALQKKRRSAPDSKGDRVQEMAGLGGSAGPNFDGFGVLREFRRRRLKEDVPPVIVFSMRATPFDLVVLHELGASAVYHKALLLSLPMREAAWVAYDVLQALIRSVPPKKRVVPGVRYLGTPSAYRTSGDSPAVRTPRTQLVFERILSGFERGKVVVTVGPWGSGRSTLLRAAAYEYWYDLASARSTPEPRSTLRVHELALSSMTSKVLSDRLRLVEMDAREGLTLVYVDMDTPFAPDVGDSLRHHLRRMAGPGTESGEKRVLWGFEVLRRPKRNELESVQDVARFLESAGCPYEIVVVPSVVDRFVPERGGLVKEDEFWPLLKHFYYQALLEMPWSGASPMPLLRLAELERKKDDVLRELSIPYDWPGEVAEVRHFAELLASRWDGKTENLWGILRYTLDTFPLPRVEYRDPQEAIVQLTLRRLHEGYSIYDVVRGLIFKVVDICSELYSDEECTRLLKSHPSDVLRFIRLSGKDLEELLEVTAESIARLLKEDIGGSRSQYTLDDIVDRLTAWVALRVWRESGGNKSQVYRTLGINTTPGRRLLDRMVEVVVEESQHDFEAAAKRLGHISAQKLQDWYERIKGE